MIVWPASRPPVRSPGVADVFPDHREGGQDTVFFQDPQHLWRVDGARPVIDGQRDDLGTVVQVVDRLPGHGLVGQDRLPGGPRVRRRVARRVPRLPGGGRPDELAGRGRAGRGGGCRAAAVAVARRVPPGAAAGWLPPSHPISEAIPVITPPAATTSIRRRATSGPRQPGPARRYQACSLRLPAYVIFRSQTLMTAQGGAWLEAAGPVPGNYRHLVITPPRRGAGESRKLYQTRPGETGRPGASDDIEGGRSWRAPGAWSPWSRSRASRSSWPRRSCCSWGCAETARDAARRPAQGRGAGQAADRVVAVRPAAGSAAGQARPAVGGRGRLPGGPAGHGHRRRLRRADRPDLAARHRAGAAGGQHRQAGHP